MALVRRVLGIALVVVLLLAIFGGGWLVGRLASVRSSIRRRSPTPERQFAERMQNVTMIGSFTIAGREDRTPQPDRYDIFERREGWRRPVAVQRQHAMLRRERRHPHRRAHAVERRHPDDHDDRHQPAGDWARSPCACSSTAIAMPARGSTAPSAVTCRDGSRSGPRLRHDRSRGSIGISGLKGVSV